MPAEFPFEESKIQNPRLLNDEDAPFTYREDDDGRLWDLLTTYADGEVTEAEAAEVEALLRSDAAYAQDLALLKRMNAQMRSFSEVEPPAHLRDAILSATTRRPTFSRRLLAGLEGLRATLSAPMVRYAGTFATAALLTFVFWPRDNQTPIGTPPSTPPVVADTTAPKPPESEKGLKPNGGQRLAAQAAPSAVKSPNGKTGPKTENRSLLAARNSTNNAALDSAESIAPKNQIKKNTVARVKPGRSSHNVQNSGAIEPKSSVSVADYGPRPMMDKDYQRPFEVSMKTGTDDNSLKIPDYQPEDSNGPGGSGDSNSRLATNDGMGTPETGPRTAQFRRGIVLPALSRRYVSGADLRREHEAATLGYTRSTVLSIQRSELTGNVVGRF